MSDSTPILKSVGHRRWNHFWQTGYRAHESILYFGRWKRVSGDGANAARSNTQYNAFEFSFRGPVVQWMGSRGPDQGVADVYVDGEFCQSVDAYSGTLESDVLKFEKNDLRDHRVHTLRVVVRKERNPQATDCYQDVTTLRAVEPVVYPLEISNAMSAEYGKIQDGTKEYRSSRVMETGRKPGRFSCDRRYSELRAPLGRVLEKHRLPQSFVCHSRILRRRRLERRLSERHMIYPQSGDPSADR